MKRLIVFFCLLLAGCSSGPTPREQALLDLKWTYDEHGIQLNLYANKELNQYEGQAHSLMLIVVQLEKINAFTNYIQNSQQLSSLLMKENSPPEFLGIKRLFISPGEQRSIMLPRLEGTKVIGIVAGYAHLDPSRSARLYQIGVDVTKNGFFSSTWHAAPQPLAIDLLLGPDGLLLGEQKPLMLQVPKQPIAGELPLPDVDTNSGDIYQ